MVVKKFQILKKVKKTQKQQNIINRKAIAAANKQKKEVKKLEMVKITAKRWLAKAIEI